MKELIEYNQCYEMGRAGPGNILALNIIKYIGAAYILWLAIHIAISKPDFSEDAG